MSELWESADGVPSDNSDRVVSPLRSRAEGEVGNPKLRCMSEFAVRRALAKQWSNRPDLRGQWNDWANNWRDKEHTYRAATFRGFERGEKGGRI